MMNCNFRKLGKARPGLGAGAGAGGGPLALLLLVISCGTVNRSVVVLPDVPGAKYIGSKECEQCHEQIYRDLPPPTTPG